MRPARRLQASFFLRLCLESWPSQATRSGQRRRIRTQGRTAGGTCRGHCQRPAVWSTPKDESRAGIYLDTPFFHDVE